ncbi:MAG: zinc dependent phospholipase C family protein [Clostridium sp.]
MPGFTTHYIFGMKAYNDMPNNQLKRIVAKYRWLYQLGLQGPDMFFYNLPVLRHRDHRNVGSYMHEHHVGAFFECCIKHIDQISSKQQREEAIAYFAGFISHYIADYICHPFVYARIGYDAANPSVKYSGNHAALENDLDAILLKYYKKKKPSEFNQTASICLNGQELQFISRFLSDCINETYYPVSYKKKYHVTPALVHRSVWALRFGCRTLADKSGHKKNSIEFIESIFLKNPIASAKLVTDTISDYRKSCNLDHEVWCNPWDCSMASTISFVDLLYRALAECHQVYYLLNVCIGEPSPMNQENVSALLNELGNYSYHSGLPVS